VDGRRLLLSFLCLVWYPSLLLQPAATFAALTRPDFWPLLLLDGVLNVIAYYLFVRAFRLSDASLVAPLILLTPVLLLVTSLLILSAHVPPCASTPLLWAATLTTFIALCSIAFWLAMPHRPLRLRDTRYAVLSGTANAVGNALLMYALTALFVP
jgi:drug/metabolite transporter (DMT)-like permease